MDPESTKKTTIPAFGEGDSAEQSQAQLDCLITMAGSNVGQVFPLERGCYLIGRGDDSDIQIMDGGISRNHAQICWDRAVEAFILEDLGSSNGTLVNEVTIGQPYQLKKGDKIQLGVKTVLRYSTSDELETRYAQRMYQAVLRDALTGVFNRRYLNQRLEAELAFAHRHCTPLAVLFLDIDHFKTVNDQYDHLFGDAVLRQFSAVVNQTIRTEDVLARYGGEEFAIIGRECSLEQALVMAERIRKAVESSRFSHDGIMLSITVSIGVAAYDGKGFGVKEAILEAADKALLQAKGEGRNRVVAAVTNPVV
jgi:diguanylate cyclase (GGDEF)-like protein